MFRFALSAASRVGTASVCLSARLVRQGQSFTPPHDSAKVTDAAMVVRDGRAGAGQWARSGLKGRSLRPRAATAGMEVVLGRRPAHKPSRANRVPAPARGSGSGLAVEFAQRVAA